MFWDFIFNVIFWRSNRKIAREIDDLCADNDRVLAACKKRIAEVLTEDEWSALDARMRREHPYLF